MLNEVEEIKVLNHGFVRLIDMMGDDSSIVQAARVSYGKGTKTITEDEGLIRYLLRHRHTTPFEMVEFKFHVKLPIFVARQWVRHRTFSFNEVSGRYSEMKDEFFVPELETLTKQSSLNKQGGSQELIDDPKQTKRAFEDSQFSSYFEYEAHLETGLRKELARIDLPLALYTEWYCKVDLHNLLHFLKLRLDSHAQYEIRVYGEAIATLIKHKIPLTWKAFEDYVLNSITLSELDIKALRFAIDGEHSTEEVLFMSNRERDEFNKKWAIIKGDKS